MKKKSLYSIGSWVVMTIGRHKLIGEIISKRESRYFEIQWLGEKKGTLYINRLWLHPATDKDRLKYMIEHKL